MIKKSALFLSLLTLTAIAEQPKKEVPPSEVVAQTLKIFGGLAITGWTALIAQQIATEFPADAYKSRAALVTTGALAGAAMSYQIFKNLKLPDFGIASQSEDLTFIRPEDITEDFNSVAGATVAKKQMIELVEYLKGSSNIIKLGGKPSKGLLLVGGPGNGKTLLARALAKEAGCSFLSVSRGYFQGMLRGETTRKLKALFTLARKHSPCIIFFDEFDAIGSKRMEEVGPSSGLAADHNAFIAEFLTQLDGLSNQKNTGLFIIGATNRPEAIDAALKRSGRFDKEIVVPKPDLKARKQILENNCKKLPIDSTVDLQKLAQGTPGMSGADVVNLVNQAIEAAARRNSETISAEDFEQGRDMILLGQEQPDMLFDEQTAWEIAVHEAGHAIAGVVQNFKDLYKVTIIPRGPAGGVTWFFDRKENYLPSQKELRGEIVMLLAAAAAEELILGNSSLGVSSDFHMAEGLARSMVQRFGMSTLGATASADLYYASEDLKAQIDRACQTLVQQCHQEAKKLVANNKEKLMKLAHALVEHKTLTGSQVLELLGLSQQTAKAA